MSQGTDIRELMPEADSQDPLSELLRRGARQLLQQAVEAELESFLERYRDVQLTDGRQAVVRNGYQPERTVQTGIGDVAVRTPKVRDRTGSGIRFHSALLPPYLRRTRSLSELLPWLYLKGVSTGDFQEALEALLGPAAPGLSAATISRLKRDWQAEHAAWCERDLSDRRYVYWWADGVYFNIRAEAKRPCLLVIMGVREDGTKELVTIDDGVRESEQSWTELLIHLRDRQNLRQGPWLAVGDGSLGFWKALTKVYGATRHQRCWVHKTASYAQSWCIGEFETGGVSGWNGSTNNHPAMKDTPWNTIRMSPRQDQQPASTTRSPTCCAAAHAIC